VRSEVRLDGAQGLDDVGEEARGVVVGVVEPQPRDSPALLGRGPLRQEGRLPEAGWRGEQRQFATHAFAHELEELATDDVLGSDGRPGELRLEDDRAG